MKTKRIWLFRSIAFAIPIVFFVLLELTLRLSGFGKALPLFIVNHAAPDYLLPNPDIVQRYFASPEQAPKVSMEANFLVKTKPQNSVRIVVQGGSTAAGFPYGLGASIAGMLDQRLKDTLPGKHVEVINTAMSAVNSYTLLDFADEIIAQRPDAVLIYAGHNEYLGILGVGSSYNPYGSATSNLLFLKFKSLRTFQLMQQLVSALQSAPSQAPEDASNTRTLMAKVAKHKDIALHSQRYHDGIAQFERNMGLLLAKYQEAGIAVFIATIGSNWSGQAPFVSDVASQSQLQQLQQLRTAAQQKRLTQAQLQKFSDNALAESGSADLHFELGHVFLATDDANRAKTHFRMAKDLDKLRFRAPEEINQQIRKLAQDYDATLVEAEAALVARSPNGIIGNSLMLEHLHPNLQGYFVISNAFYDALQQAKLFGDWHSISAPQAWQRRPVLPAEEYYGFAKILNLKNDYPFRDTPQPLTLPKPADWQQQIGYDYYGKKLDWLAMVQASRQGYITQSDRNMLLKIDRLLADALPHSARANFNAGNSLLGAKQAPLANYYFQRALQAPDITPEMHARIKQIKVSPP